MKSNNRYHDKTFLKCPFNSFNTIFKSFLQKQPKFLIAKCLDKKVSFNTFVKNSS